MIAQVRSVRREMWRSNRELDRSLPYDRTSTVLATASGLRSLSWGLSDLPSAARAVFDSRAGSSGAHTPCRRSRHGGQTPLPGPSLVSMGWGRWGLGAMLAGLVAVTGCSASASLPVATHYRPLAADRAAVSYWTTRADADSQLLVSRVQQEDATQQALPPCPRTPAVNPPCTGFDLVTAGGMSVTIDLIGRLVDDAQLQITNDQRWLQAFQSKLKKDEHPVPLAG